MSHSPTSNIWQYKPWWCQPWTILLTGIGIISGSWLLFHQIWLTAIVSLVIIIWWLYFLVLIPYAFKQQSLKQES